MYKLIYNSFEYKLFSHILLHLNRDKQVSLLFIQTNYLDPVCVLISST